MTNVLRVNSKLKIADFDFLENVHRVYATCVIYENHIMFDSVTGKIGS